jgi:signal transduction histidine kinase
VPRTLSDGVRRDLLLSGALAALVALGLAWLFAQSVARPVTELRDVARSLAAGDLSRRPSISASGELGELATAVHQLSEELSTRMGALSSEERLVAALLDSLQEGVIAVDSRRRVVRINSAGRELLRIGQPTPFSSDLLPRDRQLREAIADSLAGRTVDDTEVEMESSRVILTARPLTGGGAVVALFDITAVRRLETVRRDFVANVSHELRTPLTIIGGFAETLVSGDVPPQKAVEFAEAIRSNAVRMQLLVDDLLDLSRIESGGWAPKPGTLNVQDVFDEVASLVRRRAEAKGLTVQCRVMPGAEMIHCDPTALRQILGNLLENALRHTTEGGMSVVAAPYEKGVRISVHDTGAGIPSEHLPRIFERFYRVDPGRTRDQGGTGLGLSIVRHLVEAHGGTVSAESVIRRGTTVTVDFPAARS